MNFLTANPLLADRASHWIFLVVRNTVCLLVNREERRKLAGCTLNRRTRLNRESWVVVISIRVVFGWSKGGVLTVVVYDLKLKTGNLIAVIE